MAATQYIPGQRFYFLTYLREAPSEPKKRRAVYLCDCGNETIAYVANVKRGNTKSCGCFRRVHSTVKSTTHGRSRKSDRAYKAWTHMRGRCMCDTDHKYPSYGGRGIKVCDRWSSFENFLTDMGEPPSGTTIDRIDNDGDYEPGNCRWATPTEQANNRRSSRIVECGGIRMTIAQWSKKTGVPAGLIFSRLKAGWSPGRALVK
ncbi:hypothetical protein [Burkholderia sp. JKS000303]|uniref:hypothetical protein n=1 Tax=Burkholderia sp. JKS000303 TaxID=1938747 RepID=UPI000C00B521|nr:hypothetical protein [Burkholderia sp. JKS000303]PFH29161.1 hypothetical protein BX604_2933 [Burkholderia sp. JKS000303]